MEPPSRERVLAARAMLIALAQDKLLADMPALEIGTVRLQHVDARRVDGFIIGDADPVFSLMPGRGDGLPAVRVFKPERLEAVLEEFRFWLDEDRRRARARAAAKAKPTSQ